MTSGPKHARVRLIDDNHPELGYEKKEDTMHKDRIAEWAEALESGDYKQTSGALYNGEAYCCLGVACSLYLEANDVGLDIYDLDENGDNTLPVEVSNWLGIADDNPSLDGESAITRNDDNDEDFSTIAAAIRREYLGEV